MDSCTISRQGAFMSDDVKLTHTSALILQVISGGCRYGLDIMQNTGLPSGTVYPALRRLEQSSLVESTWEKERDAFAEQRPARKYYRLTRAGEAALAKAVKRYRLLENLTMENGRGSR